MESRERRAEAMGAAVGGGQHGRGDGGAAAIARSRSFPTGYYSAESLLLLLCLTASLLILPLVLPPLPPPPLLLLLVPVGIMAVLMALALMPSDVRDIASSYL